ncbi:hypothetical protein [Candidatus Methylobacter favarea]|uniref:hypothetical protein n=1 Tax=Candidatus Methylobacter favarea TaxID=2707345 RepID=UPI00157D05EE|nr:hypothetical protein [Candidatus Methylobacter favarea]
MKVGATPDFQTVAAAQAGQYFQRYRQQPRRRDRSFPGCYLKIAGEFFDTGR